MTYWVIKDENNKDHVVWTDIDKYEALGQIPGSVSVRTPTANDLKQVAVKEDDEIQE